LLTLERQRNYANLARRIIARAIACPK